MFYINIFDRNLGLDESVYAVYDVFGCRIHLQYVIDLVIQL